MFSLLIRKALLQDPARTWRVVFAVALGAAVTTSVTGVSIGIGDQVEREFRSYGANIEVVSSDSSAARPTMELDGIRYALQGEAPTLPVQNLGALKSIFWGNNIVGFTPFLESTFDLQGRPVRVTGTWFRRPLDIPENKGRITTGVRVVEPWWQVTGSWPEDSETNGCLVGEDLARSSGIHTGDHLAFDIHGQKRELQVRGIVRTGGEEENEVIAPLAVVQSWTNHPGRAGRIEVSALVKPDDELAHKDPAHLSDSDREKLVCSPYIGSITSEIAAALPGVEAHPIYRVADSEGKLLGRIQLLMGFVLAAALLAALLGAGSATAAAAVQRRPEMGLVQALGATRTSLLIQLIVEAALLGMAGGLLGVPVGMALEHWIGKVVFGTAAPIPWIVAPVGLALALSIAIASSLLPLWSALRVDPARVLGGE